MSIGSQNAMDVLRTQWGGMDNIGTGYRPPSELSNDNIQATDQMRDTMYDRYLRGTDVNDLGSILGRYYAPEADRLQGQLPGLEQGYLDLINQGVDYGSIGEGLEGATMGFLRQMFESGGYFDTQTNVGLGANIQAGRGVHGGGFETARRTNDTTMMGMTSDRIAQLIPQLYSSAGNIYGSQLSGMGGLLQHQAGRRDAMTDSLFSGKMGMSNLRMTEEDRILGAGVTTQNLWAQAEDMKAKQKAGGIGGILGGVAGAALGSFLGPLGTKLGGTIGSSLFGGNTDTTPTAGVSYNSSTFKPGGSGLAGMGSFGQAGPFFGDIKPKSQFFGR